MTTTTRISTISILLSTNFPSANGLTFTINRVTDDFASSNLYYISS